MKIKQETADMELMACIAGGDKAAFSQLMQKHLAMVLNFNKQYVPLTAEDITQEAFIRLWKKAPDWQDKGISPRAWLLQVSYNMCIDELRKNKTVSLDDQSLPMIESSRSDEQILESQSDILQLLQALKKLPERQRSAITLCACNGLNNQEAAKVLGVSVAALESLLARGRRTLRNLHAQSVAA